MIVTLTAEGELELLDAHNFRALSFGRDRDRRYHDDPLVTLAEDHAWILSDALRAYAPLTNDLNWRRGLEAMLTFAREHGWMNVSGDRVRAHIVALPVKPHEEGAR